ncbi:MAG: hypothetical protein AB1489_41915 [Acidobacteriota bacterium]
MSAMSKYYCVVLKVEGNKFQAKVVDYDDVIECKFEEVDEEEWPLIKPGAQFRTYMGRYKRVIAFGTETSNE